MRHSFPTRRSSDLQHRKYSTAPQDSLCSPIRFRNSLRTAAFVLPATAPARARAKLPPPLPSTFGVRLQLNSVEVHRNRRNVLSAQPIYSGGLSSTFTFHKTSQASRPTTQLCTPPLTQQIEFPSWPSRLSLCYPTVFTPLDIRQAPPHRCSSERQLALPSSKN